MNYVSLISVAVSVALIIYVSLLKDEVEYLKLALSREKERFDSCEKSVKLMHKSNSYLRKELRVAKNQVLKAVGNDPVRAADLVNGLYKDEDSNDNETLSNPAATEKPETD